MGACEYEKIKLVVNKDITIDVFEESGESCHRLGRISFQDRNIKKFHENLASLVIDASITAQRAGSQQNILDKVSSMKIYWVLNFEH